MRAPQAKRNFELSLPFTLASGLLLFSVGAAPAARRDFLDFCGNRLVGYFLLETTEFALLSEPSRRVPRNGLAGPESRPRVLRSNLAGPERRPRVLVLDFCVVCEPVRRLVANTGAVIMMNFDVFLSVLLPAPSPALPEAMAGATWLPRERPSSSTSSDDGASKGSLRRLSWGRAGSSRDMWFHHPS